MSMLIFIIVLSVLISVHEWGHFITAKRLGVKVDEFSLGFGPKLWSKVYNGTEYKLCVIPLGGYVKMAGDERKETKGASYEFFGQSVGHRSLIVLMGPVVNFVFAYLCFWVVFMLGHINPEETAKNVPAQVGIIEPGSPAEKAGLQVGDKVVRINETPIEYWVQLQEHVSESKAADIEVGLIRNGRPMTQTIESIERTQKDLFGREHKVRRIGVGPQMPDNDEYIVIEKYNPVVAFGRAGKELSFITVQTYKALYEMVTGQRSPKEMMGIVGMYSFIDRTKEEGFSFLLYFVAIISASLAIFNLLPIIPLDGGHIALFGIEKLRGQPLPVKIEDMVMRTGFSLIIVLAVWVFYVDFERIGVFDKINKIFKPVSGSIQMTPKTSFNPSEIKGVMHG